MSISTANGLIASPSRYLLALRVAVLAILVSAGFMARGQADSSGTPGPTLAPLSPISREERLGTARRARITVGVDDLQLGTILLRFDRRSSRLGNKSQAALQELIRRSCPDTTSASPVYRLTILLPTDAHRQNRMERISALASTVAGFPRDCRQFEVSCIEDSAAVAARMASPGIRDRKNRRNGVWCILHAKISTDRSIVDRESSFVGRLCDFR